MKVGFIGIGKIAVAMTGGICRSAAAEADLFLSPRNGQNSRALAEKYARVHRMDSNQAVLDRSDIIILALRPAQAAEALAELRFDPRHTVISVIPLMRLEELVRYAGAAASISRAIPLPPVIRHRCPIPVFQPTETVMRLLSYIGQPLPVATEEELHALWTLTGLITPFYELMDTLSAWTVENGVEKERADRYIADLFYSLSFMAQQAGSIDFDELARHAATPQGMNEQAGKEIRELGAHAAYRIAADHLRQRFR